LGRHGVRPSGTPYPHRLRPGLTSTLGEQNDTANKELVLGFFSNEAAADAAVESLKGWCTLSPDIKLGASGGPPWPGRQEAVIIDGPWVPDVGPEDEGLRSSPSYV
jgi:hypothetical protein